MKNKPFLILLSLFLLTGFIMTDKLIVYSAEIPRISAVPQSVKKIEDDKYLIPVYLVHNPGIMGFRLVFQYDSSKICIEAVERGVLTKQGSFGMSTDVKDETSVLWSFTENVITDGSVCYLIVTTKDSTDISLQLNYVQEDTFDETWSDVVLSCDSIDVELQSLDEKQPDIDENLEEIIISEDEQTITDNILSDAKKKNPIDEIGYKNVQEEMLVIMQKEGYKSLSDIPEDQEESFVNELKDSLHEKYQVKRKLLDGISFADLENEISMTQDILHNDDMANKDNNKESGNKKPAILLLGAIICILLCVIIVMFVFVRRSRKYKKLH